MSEVSEEGGKNNRIFQILWHENVTFNHLNMFKVNCKISEQHQDREENKLIFIEFLTFLQIIVCWPEAHVEIKT